MSRLFQKVNEGATRLFSKVSQNAPRLLSKVSNGLGSASHFIGKIANNDYVRTLAPEISGVANTIGNILGEAGHMTNLKNYNGNASNNVHNALEKAQNLHKNVKNALHYV